MTQIAAALSISRPHLSTSSAATGQKRAAYTMADDVDMLARIREIVHERPTNGYRRVCARINAQCAQNRVNPKRIYRLMRQANLLLRRFGRKPERQHDGKVITLQSDMRWCSDWFEIRCWNGEKVHVAFSLDCVGREIISWVARDGALDGSSIRDLMAQTVEGRFGATRAPRPVEWLTDNGPPYTAQETRKFGKDCGLLVRNTPAYSPESNGMAEAFVKTFKRDYAYLAELKDAASVLAQLQGWFEDYNDHHPHKGLNMRSPRQFRQSQVA